MTRPRPRHLRDLAALILIGAALGCGPDITFDPEARGLIERFDPDAGAAPLDVGVGDEDDAGPLATLDHAGWDAVTRRFLVAGCVDYQALSDSGEARGVLSTYIDQLRRVDLSSDALDADSRAALWLNAYNAFVVAAVVQELEADPEFRVDEDDFAFFSDRRFVVGGLLVSLDQLEHGALRGQADHPSLESLDADTRQALLDEAEALGGLDPRVHFAVNCASRSCPDLRAGAFEGESLDAQLDAQTRAFLADPTRGAGPEGVSSLFDWFAADFQRAGSVGDFIAEHREGGVEGVDTGAFLPYDWALNRVDPDHPQCQP